MNYIYPKCAVILFAASYIGLSASQLTLAVPGISNDTRAVPESTRSQVITPADTLLVAQQDSANSLGSDVIATKEAQRAELLLEYALVDLHLWAKLHRLAGGSNASEFADMLKSQKLETAYMLREIANASTQLRTDAENKSDCVELLEKIPEGEILEFHPPSEVSDLIDRSKRLLTGQQADTKSKRMTGELIICDLSNRLKTIFKLGELARPDARLRTIFQQLDATYSMLHATIEQLQENSTFRERVQVDKDYLYAKQIRQK